MVSLASTRCGCRHGSSYSWLAAHMLHALRHHWGAFETDDPAVTMFIGPSGAAEPLEVVVVTDEEGTAIIHAMKACPKFLKGRWTK